MTRTYEITVWFKHSNSAFYFSVNAKSRANAIKAAKRKVDASAYRARLAA